MKKVLLLAFVAATFLISCSKKEDEAKLSKSHYTLHSSETEKIQGTNIENLEWVSYNEFVASVKDGEVKGMFVGNTKICDSKYGVCFTVDVVPKYHLYNEPNIEWGLSKASIKSLYGEPKTSSEDVLFYESGNSNVPLYGYMFKNDALYCSAVFAQISTASILADFLTERYLPVKIDMSKYTAYLTHCSGKIKDPKIDYVVTMSYQSSIGAIAVLYMNAENNNTKNKKSDINGELTKALLDAKVKL